MGLSDRAMWAAPQLLVWNRRAAANARIIGLLPSPSPSATDVLLSDRAALIRPCLRRFRAIEW